MKNCVIIVNYNDYQSTKHLVDNIIDYSIIDWILIVDNASTPVEQAKIRKIKNAKIEIIYNSTNVGYSKAINIAAKHLIKKYQHCNFIISNSDIVILSENDLRKLIGYLDYDQVGVVSPQILEKAQINRGHKAIGPKRDALMNIALFRQHLQKRLKYPQEYYESETSVVEVVSTAFFLIRSDILKKIDYLDENIFLYYEEQALGAKIRAQGLMLVVVNTVKLKHLYSISVNKSLTYKEKYLLVKNSQYYYHCQYNHPTIITKLLLKATAKIGYLFVTLGTIMDCYHDTPNKLT